MPSCAADALIMQGGRYFKDRNRQVVWLLLDKIEASNDPVFLPALVTWEAIDYKKVQARIRRVIARLRGEVVTNLSRLRLRPLEE